MDESSWIADGTAEVEPVTTETPEAVEAVDIEQAGQPRDDHGRWVSASDDATAGATEPVEATEVAEAVGATETEAAALQAFIEAKLGDEPFKIPEGVLLPQKRGDEVEYRSLDEIIKDGMRGKDYTLKTTELAQLRRDLDRRDQEFAKQEARIAAREKYIGEQEAEIKAALTDPKSAAAYQEHLVQYANNPIYRKNVDLALRTRETEAELSALRESADERLVSEASETALGWIEGLASEYPGVDPERVRGLYARALQSGGAQLSEGAVRQIYQSEADYVDRTVSPLRSELADLRATIESLQAAKAAETHNQTTQHAVQRAKAPKVNTGGGAPVRAPVAPTKFGPNELVERNQAWISAG
jgi:hypothetical protein